MHFCCHSAYDVFRLLHPLFDLLDEGIIYYVGLTLYSRFHFVCLGHKCSCLLRFRSALNPHIKGLSLARKQEKIFKIIDIHILIFRYAFICQVDTSLRMLFQFVTVVSNSRMEFE
jgi:hypothetical protein